MTGASIRDRQWDSLMAYARREAAAVALVRHRYTCMMERVMGRIGDGDDQDERWAHLLKGLATRMGRELREIEDES